MSALLELRNVETYYGPIMAIRGVSLEVRDQQIVTLLGANGAGKTTVLKTISGAMDPQKGTVTLAGENIQRRDPDAVARLGVAHVPEGREIFPFLSVDENLRIGAFSRHDNKIDEDLVAEALAANHRSPERERGRRRLHAFLNRRGFTRDAIRAALTAALERATDLCAPDTC